MNTLKNFVCEESGQDLVEYALLLVLLALAAVAVLGSMGEKINSVFGNANEAMS